MMALALQGSRFQVETGHLAGFSFPVLLGRHDEQDEGIGAVPGPGIGLSCLDEEVEELREMPGSGCRLPCDR